MQSAYQSMIGMVHALNEAMTSVTIGELLKTTEAALTDLRRRYAAIHRRCGDSPQAMLADLLSQREMNTIAAIDGYRVRDEHHAVLDVHVRLGGGFPFADTPRLPKDPTLEELFATAEQTDQALASLGERVELYAAGAELHSAFDAIDAIVRRRRQQLANAARELEDLLPNHTGDG